MVKTALMHHKNLAIDNVDKARDFYGRVLGLQELKRPNTGQLGLWFGCEDPAGNLIELNSSIPMQE